MIIGAATVSETKRLQSNELRTGGPVRGPCYECIHKALAVLAIGEINYLGPYKTFLEFDRRLMTIFISRRCSGSVEQLSPSISTFQNSFEPYMMKGRDEQRHAFATPPALLPACPVTVPSSGDAGPAA